MPRSMATNSGVSDMGTMAAFIRAMPSNSIPNPIITDPTYRTWAFFINRYITAPTNRITGA